MPSNLDYMCRKCGGLKSDLGGEFFHDKVGYICDRCDKKGIKVCKHCGGIL